MVYARSLAEIGRKPGSYRPAKDVNLENLHQDRGCRDISDSCLTCPLPRCVEEYPSRMQAQIRQRFREGLAREGFQVINRLLSELGQEQGID
jgi:hypothetical protein